MKVSEGERGPGKRVLDLSEHRGDRLANVYGLIDRDIVHVKLTEIPSAGYSWELAKLPAGIVCTGDSVLSKDHGERIGTPVEVTWTFRVASSDARPDELVLEYRRPWEPEPLYSCVLRLWLS